MHDTKNRILDAAEKLFAEHGYDATSLRVITQAAGVNLAAVNYHFNSKDSLIRAVFSRRLAPLAEQRLSMLDAYELESDRRPVPVEKLVRALVVPAIRMMHDPAGGGASFARLLGRMYSSPNSVVQNLFFQEIEGGVARFTAAFHRSAPALPFEEMACRIFFGIGVMSHAMACGWLLPKIAGGKADLSDMEQTIERIVAFFVAGMSAPVPARLGARSRCRVAKPAALSEK
jgi:AcrR family transcriptional regulator